MKNSGEPIPSNAWNIAVIKCSRSSIISLVLHVNIQSFQWEVPPIRRIWIWIPLLQAVKRFVLLNFILPPIFTTLLHRTLLSFATSRLLTDFGNFTDALVDHVNYRFFSLFFVIISKPFNQYPSGGSPSFTIPDGAKLSCDGVRKHDKHNFSNAASRSSRLSHLFFF